MLHAPSTSLKFDNKELQKSKSITLLANIATSRAPVGAKRKYPKPADVGMLDQV